MEFILNLAIKSLEQVWLSLLHNWPYLAVSVVIAALLKLYVNAEKVAAFLNRYRGAGVVVATAAAVATPLCSCGSTAVMLGMMASTMPWAPIVAFMVSSPLTSPEGLVYSAGLFGWPFALAFYLASIILGLAGGWIATAFESRGWLANQARFAEPVPAPWSCSANNRAFIAPGQVFSSGVPGVRLSNQGATCGCAGTVLARPSAGCAGDSSGPVRRNSQVALQTPRVNLTAILRELYHSAKYLLIMFTGFAFLGYFLNSLIPAHWVAAVFGSGNIYNVLLAATLGLPLYINAEASLPLIRALLDAGMSQGAALAFMIVGAGTSIGAIGGALAIARWRVIVLVVGILWIGAILCGYAFNLVLTLGFF